MSVLEQYRDMYEKWAIKENRHYFQWSAKKTEAGEEHSLDYPLGLSSMNIHIKAAAAKDLAEGIEMWLKPVVIPQSKYMRRSWLDLGPWSFRDW